MSSQCYKQHRIEKVVADVIKNNNFKKIIVTLSGGADSVALLSALKAYNHPYEKISLIAVHCNFHLRGEESMRDQHFVEQICAQLDVPLILKDFDVEGYMKLNPSLSVEMACRELRYDWFANLKESLQADRIATGHNADDNIETLLLNLLRGSGTSGLKGMIIDNTHILRPLLSIHRKEIEEYLNIRGLPHITDSSNLSSDYRRNFLRNDIIPLLRSRWPGFDKALDRSIYLLKTENDIVEQSVNAALPDPGKPLTIDRTLAYPAPELLIRRFILPLQPFTTTAAEILAAMKAKKSDLRRWNLPGGTVTLRGDRLYFERLSES